MLEHDMDFGQVQVMAISMAFAKKMMGFPSDLGSFPTKLPSTRHEKIRDTFLTECLQNIELRECTECQFVDRYVK